MLNFSFFCLYLTTSGMGMHCHETWTQCSVHARQLMSVLWSRTQHVYQAGPELSGPRSLPPKCLLYTTHAYGGLLGHLLEAGNDSSIPIKCILSFLSTVCKYHWNITHSSLLCWAYESVSRNLFPFSFLKCYASDSVNSILALEVASYGSFSKACNTVITLIFLWVASH